MRIAYRQFKEGCPNLDSVAVVMSDKEFTELAVLQEEFSGPRVLLCHFHVIKYLQEELERKRTIWMRGRKKDEAVCAVAGESANEVAYAAV